ncbi:MAG: hypothetical protein N3D18_09170 [Roseococcus sp.]|nr:hypothetical protein [Roseococcus sp.]
MLTASCERGLLVSLPGAEILRAPLARSVFGPQELNSLVLSPELRTATNLVMAAMSAAGRPLRFIARPEMFTHGVLTERLSAELGGIADHLALSDGRSCRLLPGMRNHLFFYRRTVPEAVEALRALVARAPETFSLLHSQVNGTLSFRMDGTWWRPTTSLLRFTETPRLQEARRLPFVMHPGSAERAAELSLLAEKAMPDGTDIGQVETSEGDLRSSPRGVPLLHVPLSAAVLADSTFLRWLAERMLASTLRGDQKIVLELPPSSGDDAEVSRHIAAAVRSLAVTGVSFPRTPSRHVAWCTAVPAAQDLQGARVLLHPGVDFWRYGEEMWRVLDEVLVAQQSPAGARFTALIRQWLDGLAPVRALRPEMAPHRVKVGTVV